MSRNGIGMTTGVREEAGWRIGDTMEVGFIPKARCILLRSVADKEEFSKAGVNKIEKGAVGVYELLGTGDAVLRVGEGKIKDRMNAHLNDERFSPPTVKAFHHIDLEDPADGKILERIQIERFFAETGVLPRSQEIRA